MKKKNLLLMGLAAVAVMFTACNKGENINPNETESNPATLKITIVGETGGKTRAIDASPVIVEESQIKDYTVIVVNSLTNKIQAVQTFNSGLTNTITGLTSGSKKVVVITNTANAGISLPGVGQDYSIINNPVEKLGLETQAYDNMKNNGFVMSGETAVTLNPGANTLPSELKVTRVVAKVKLGSVTIAPEAGHDGDFQLTNVHIMKAPSFATYGTGVIATSLPYLGGTLGDVSTQVSAHLTNILTNADKTGRLFYVFPNDNATNNATLLTIEGTYNGEVRYFPIRINDGVGTAGSTTDGSFIKRNGQYTINVTIKRPGDGSVNPEVPVDPATLEMTISVEDWATELVQNVEI